jgi:Immunity protein 74
MTFSTVDANTFSDLATGVTVKVMGKVGITYKLGKRSAMVSSEVLVTNAIAVYSNSITNWDDGNPITDAERERILDDIREAISQCTGDTIQVI